MPSSSVGSATDGWAVSADEPMLMQTGPETFRAALPDGRLLELRLAHHTRRGLGLPTVPPRAVATEMVCLLLERGALPDGLAPDGGVLDLGPATLRFPEAVDELRARLG